MAKFVLTDAYVSINSVALSNRVRSVTINYSADEVEQTTMSDGTHNFLGGLKNYSVDIEFGQDFAASNVDATMFGIVGTAVAVEIRPTSSSRSATNPGYNATMLVAEYNPIGNSIGELATATARFVPGGASPTLLRSVA